MEPSPVSLPGAAPVGGIDNAPLIEVRSLRKEFPRGERPALEGVSAVFRPGVVAGLAGPDGAGKTTLLRLMAGLLVPTSGKVSVCGLDPVADAPALRDAIGYMPQKFGLYEDLSVMENLDLYADLKGVVEPGERARAFARLLEFTDLGRFVERPAGKLSGGMKQKLGLACALLGQPKVLLLDEPGVGVDPISRRELWRMVRELTGGGLSVLWSTSYLDEAALCDEVLLLNEGKVLYSGVPGDLTSRLAGRCFLGRGGDGGEGRRQLLVKALRAPGVLDGCIQGRSVRLVLRGGEARGESPSPSGLGLGDGIDWKPTPPRFEDAFIDLLGGAHGGESVLAAHLKPLPLDGAAVIEAAGLTRRFGSFVAADRVSFTVTRGEIFGLLGPNGAGKSTTFKMLCGLLKPTQGSAKVMGIDLRHSPGAARQRLGYMAQKFSLYGNLSVMDNLRFFSGAYGLSGARQREAIDQIVEAFAMRPFLDQNAETLPLGFKQRLALSCAVMHEPDVVFLDEPTSGVDPVTRREFWTHINGVVGKGVTVIVTTHFMDEAEYCDRIGLVFRGRLIAAGTPDDVKREASTDACPDPTMEDAFIELVRRHGESPDSTQSPSSSPSPSPFRST